MLRGQVTKYKRNAAMVFVKARLGELRAEELRRVSFFLLCIDEFILILSVTALLKVDRDENHYRLHAAVFVS